MAAYEVPDENHVYLDVIHVPDERPSPNSTVSPSTAAPNKSEPEVPKRKFSLLNIVLISAVVILITLCCLFVALYIAEINDKTSSDTHEQSDRDNSFDKGEEDSSNCNKTGEFDERGCPGMKSDQAKIANQTKADDQCVTEYLVIDGRNSTHYVKTKGAPIMNAITACFWIKLNRESRLVHYLSYVGSNGEVVFDVGEKESGSRLKTKDEMWHSVCWTWSSQDGEYKLYQDGKIIQNGSLKHRRPVSGGGTWILGKSTQKLLKPGQKSVKSDGRKPAKPERQPPKSGRKPAKPERRPAKSGRKPAKPEHQPAKSEQKPEKLEHQSKTSAGRESGGLGQKSEKSERKSEKPGRKSKELERKSKKSERKSEELERKSENSERKSEELERKSERQSEELERKSEKSTERKSEKSTERKSEISERQSEELEQKQERATERKSKTKREVNVRGKMEGELTGVNIWDKVLSRKELLRISKSCSSKYKGNVKSWDDFKVAARANVKTIKYPTCCKT